MILKSYQQQVIDDLTRFMTYLQVQPIMAKAFNGFWEEHPRTALTPQRNEAIEPYKNTISSVPHICIKVPTAGGKTYIACNALQPLFEGMGLETKRLVVWLTPSVTIRDQTLKHLRDPNHAYRQRLNLHFNGRVEVLTKEEALQGIGFNAASVAEHLTILVLSYASLRAKNKDDRKVNDDNSYLQSFESSLVDTEAAEDLSLMRVVRSLNPVVVVDESHNAESELSIDMLKNLSPSFILDLTATPRKNSNIISFVDAMELKKNNMVKLPVIVSNHRHKNEVILSVINLQKKLEKHAEEERKKGGKYIRPIVLFQAQSKGDADATTFLKIKEELVKDHKIPIDQIKIKTAVVDELKNVDLMAEDCPVRFIITINALKEGWDCPFAYILASLANRSSAVDVEQIVGRILRQPYVVKHKSQMLNMSYVFTASDKFMDTVQTVVNGLNKAGFSERDCRLAETVVKDADVPPNQIKLEFPVGVPTPPPTTPIETTETAVVSNEEVPEIDAVVEVLNETGSDDSEDSEEDPSVLEIDWAQQAEENIVRIEQLAIEQSNIMEKMAEETSYSPPTEISSQVKSYRIKPVFKPNIEALNMPQFFLKIPEFGFDANSRVTQVLLSKENLLESFQLDKCDTNLDFANVAVQMFQVDLDELNPEHTPHFKKLNDYQQKLIYQYILDPVRKGDRVKNFSDRITRRLGNDKTIKDADLRNYIRGILRGFTDTQFEHLADYEAGYANTIKAKVEQLKNTYARERFEKLLKTNDIVVQGSFKLPNEHILNQTAKAISNSLYEKEGVLNGFEERVINQIANADNILFWTRNIERQGFKLNGFINHYPDFIVQTRSNKILLIETKGDDRDNSDSEHKLALGESWEKKAGDAFKYFMVFDKKDLKGAYTLDKFMEILKQM
jgi:type III restriction enzyme